MSENRKKLAIVTGAASGIGQATAQLMGAADYSLLLCDRDAERLKASAARMPKGDCETLAVDLTGPDFATQLAKAIGDRKISAVIHAAGISPTMGDAAAVLEVNLGVPFRLLDALRDRMAKDGVIVLVASNSGHMIGTGFDAALSEAITARDHRPLVESFSDSSIAYAASKRGVQLLARHEAVAFGRQGVRILSLSPGIIDTPMGRQEMAQQPMMKHLIDASATGRSGQPEEIGAVAVFLCRHDARFMTGTDILVDGGETAAGFTMAK